MKSIFNFTLTTLFLLMGCASNPKKPVLSGPFRIPQDAKFQILSYKIVPLTDPDAETCKSERPTEKEIREQFRRAHLLSGGELHDDYVWTPCLVEGTISLNGRIMTWRFRVGNIIETNFPDGKDKVLGGEQTDSPSGE